jgi:hypothetical protein
MITPPKQNLNVAAQQNARVMNNPQVQEARRKTLEIMETFGLSTDQMKQLGQAAELAIQDKRAYPLFLKKLREFDLDDAEDFRGDIDYQALAIFATAARML